MLSERLAVYLACSNRSLCPWQQVSWLCLWTVPLQPSQRAWRGPQRQETGRLSQLLPHGLGESCPFLSSARPPTCFYPPPFPCGRACELV